MTCEFRERPLSLLGPRCFVQFYRVDEAERCVFLLDALGLHKICINDGLFVCPFNVILTNKHHSRT
jgi:hypothetical protein